MMDFYMTKVLDAQRGKKMKSKKERIKDLEGVERTLNTRQNELVRKNDRLAKRLDDLEWVLGLMGLIHKNEYVGINITRLQPLLSVTQMKEKLEKLEDFLDIKAERKPETFKYVRRT